MPTKISDIEVLVRRQLREITPRFWTSQELTDICIDGIKDLWRSIADLKQGHFFTRNDTDVFLDSGAIMLRGVPSDVHKVFEIEVLNSGSNTSSNLKFTPLSYFDKKFQAARGSNGLDPSSGGEIYYSITQPGGPVVAPIIYIAPTVTSQVPISFGYVPVLPALTSGSVVPIPGESTNALKAWMIAFARAKETDNNAPDSEWLDIYASEKAHILESLGVRQYQEPTYVQAQFEEYWG